MIEQQKAVNLPYWWSGDVERTGKRLREEIESRNFPSNQERLIFEAMDIANRYHEHQERANGEKYVIHAYRVALSLFFEFEESSVELVTAALLHDLLEDTTYTRRKMKEKFGETVERLVDVISREEDEKRPKQGDQITDKYFKKIIKGGVDSIKLKIADKLDNIRDALNHPKLEKRKLYIRECQTIFLPLLKYLENPALEKKLHELLEEAMLNHPSYIDQVLLFNPGLDYWIPGDQVQRVKIPLNPGFSAVDLVKSVAALIIYKIDSGQLDSLLYIANLPEFLNSPGKKDSWARVKIQLSILVELLSTDTPPQWLQPIMKTPEYLLAVVHSRFFMPANWLFPGQKDDGHHILETNKKLYLSIHGKETVKTEKWLARLHLLLIHRETLWRSTAGNGIHTARIMISEIKKTTQSYGMEEEYFLLVSMRLLAEYLDVITDTGIPREHVEKKFSNLWKQLNKSGANGGIDMGEVDSKISREEIEKGFKDFIKRLLEAQSYDFMKEKALFSSKTLESTLEKFCNITADELHCDSCTIHLQMYDAKMMDKELLNQFITKHCIEKTNFLEILKRDICKIAEAKINEEELYVLLKKWVKVELTGKKTGNEASNELSEFIKKSPINMDKDKVTNFLLESLKYRLELLKSSLSFPYWLYTKGAARPVAANEDSPWLHVFKDEKNESKYVTLLGGVSKAIFQENVARVRDRLSIRETRNFKKLGKADMIVWNNEGWKYVFKNFYGIPIRLHSGGEVIGILRAENKKTRWKNEDEEEEKIIHKLLSTKDTGELINGIILKIAEKFEECKRDLDSLNLSLLSLAYLEHDLKSGECTGIVNQNSGFEKLIFIPYPDYIISKLKKEPNNMEQILDEYKDFKIDSLKPAGDNKRPPMQLFTRNIDDEKKLWNLLKEEEKNDHDYCRRLYNKIESIYGVFNAYIYQVIDYKKENHYLEEAEKSKFTQAINEKIFKGKPVIISIEIEDWRKLNLPDFHFKVSLSYISIMESKIDLYMVILPTREEIIGGHIPNVEKYKEVNHTWLSTGKCTLEEYCKHRQKLKVKTLGEFVIYDESRKEIMITDYILDRLAARTQAFALSFPIADFSFEDNYKLSLAALEIGKLIEREISYRANRHDDPMPLTALEFFRIPISDLNFVDDLRIRRINSRKIADSIDVYLRNIIVEMGMTESVAYSSRIKGYRSFLQRIGERFEGYVRGNIAIWVFLLSLLIDETGINMNVSPGNKGGGDAKKREITGFFKNLGKFKESIKYLLGDALMWNEESSQFGFENFCNFLNKDNSKKIFGDLKFDSPPFMVNGKGKKDIGEKLIGAFKRIIKNLENEGIGEECFKDLDLDEGIDDYFEKNQQLFNDLLLRNYSHFVRDSLSLLIQVANLLNSLKNKGMDNFKNFYRKCRYLREFLCSSFQQFEGRKKYHLERIFSIEENPDKENKKGVWINIKDFINKYNTGTVFPGDDGKHLRLTPGTIYKRIRTLNNILHHQTPAALLDWELGRFDLYGTRMNCLYKNQGFILFEKTWNKGDPFFFYDPRAKKFDEYYKENEKIDTNKYRQRWLCLRTKVLEGEYNACQIAALIDPKTVEPEYWEYISSYNLKCVQYVLGKIFDQFEKTAAENYRSYSWHRQLISECYRKWYKCKSDLVKREIQDEDKEKEYTKWFGSFLFASVINLLMLVLDCMIDYKNNGDNKHGSRDHNFNKGIRSRHGFSEDTLKKIVDEMEKKIDEKEKNPGKRNLFFDMLNAFYWVVENGKNYCNSIKKGFMKPGLFAGQQFQCKCTKHEKSENKGNFKTGSQKLVACEKSNAPHCNLYEMALNFVNNIIAFLKNSENHPDALNTYQESRDEDIFKKIKSNLEKERDFFTGLEKVEKDEDIQGFQMPIFFFDENQTDANGYKILVNLEKIRDTLGEKLKIGKGKDIERWYWGFVYRTLEQIRREQKSYIFDIGEKRKGYGGLWLRDKEEVFERIKNYVLLFSEEDIDKENKIYFLGWNAHDLYYYIRSLIPMEIQFRTELTNTFAVQYHDDIYKVQPPTGTEFPHTMMKKAGESLEKIDRELGIDYEDYILKYHHRLEEEEDFEEDL
jgi:hypothetical protein